MTQRAAYDASGRLTSIEGTKGTSVLTRFAYTYSRSGADTGLRQSVTDKANNITAYSYDALDRLVQAKTTAAPLSPLGRRELDHVDEVDDGPYVSSTILCLAQGCYRCHNRTGPIVGVLVDPQWSLDTEGFVPFDVVAEELADATDAESFLEFGTAELKWRRTRQVPAGYVSNGCHRCDTILGSWHLSESLGANGPRAARTSG